MPEKKKDVEALAKQSTSQNSTTDSIPQNTANTQEPREYKGTKKKHKVLKAEAKVYAFAIKCYDEQMPGGWKHVVALIKAIDKKGYHIIAIRHDRDLVTDGIWDTATTKPHYHIIIRCTSRDARIRVRTMLKMLGIEFRPGIDDALWKEHGIESIGDYTGYAVYLTHETKDAIEDGKEKYEMWELVSNLELGEIEQIREGYNRLIDGKKRLTTPELEALDKDAKEMGYNMKNFESWYDSQPFIVRSNAKMKTIRESYERGVNIRLQEGSQICRMCVFIHGKPNTGKTYAAEQALAGKRQLQIGGGGTGKLDELRCDHEAIIVDDDILPNLLNMSDNKICRAYKRNRNNPPWAGKYLIITSNLSFADWVEKCGIRAKDDFGRNTAHYDALLSRFCVGRILPSEAGYNQLYIQSMSTRGSTEVQKERADMMSDFLDKYNAIIKTYDPEKVSVDVSHIVSDLSQFVSIV